jgi:hypothetical protein
MAQIPSIPRADENNKNLLNPPQITPLFAEAATLGQADFTDFSRKNAQKCAKNADFNAD